MRANWKDGPGRQKRVKMNHAAWMKIGLLESTNSRSESRDLFGLETNAQLRKMCACANTSCAVFCLHFPSATRESLLPASDTTLNKNDCTRLSIRSSSNMNANLCGSVLLLPVSRCYCREWHMIATHESSKQCLYLNPFATSFPVLLR